MLDVTAGRVFENMWPGTLLSEWDTEAQDRRGTGLSISYQLASGHGEAGAVGC